MKNKIDGLKRRKNDLGLTSNTISEESGIPLSTIQKIFAGQTKSPRFSTLTQIEAVILSHELSSGLKPESEDIELSFTKRFTVDDYYALPDEMRVELIDGRLYDMGAPTLNHQDIALRLSNMILNYLESQDKKCRVYISPIDVRIDKDNDSMVQPDVIIVCDREDDDRLNDIKCVDGAPDFAAEVLSPSSIAIDSGLKYRKYKLAGVREYWIIDPGYLIVTVCDFENGTETEYSFDDVIPILVTGGDLKIDFSKIKSHLL